MAYGVFVLNAAGPDQSSVCPSSGSEFFWGYSAGFAAPGGE